MTDFAGKRPSYKFESRRKQYLALLTKGMRRGEAAKAVGLTYECIQVHARTDPDFAREEAEAEIAACDVIEASLYAKAQEGNIDAQKFWLKNRSRDRWSDTKANITVNNFRTTEQLTPEELEKQLEDRLKELNNKEEK